MRRPPAFVRHFGDTAHRVRHLFSSAHAAEERPRVPSHYFLTRQLTLALARAWSGPRLCLAKCRKSDRHLLDTSTLCQASAPDP